MHPGAVGVNGDLRNPFGRPGGIDRLTNQQTPPFETRVFPRRNDIAFDSRQEHFGLSIDSEVIDHDAAADATKRLWVGDAFTCWCGDGIAQITFAAESQAGHARSVFDEERGVEGTRHRRHMLDVMRMNDRGMLVIVFGLE